MYVTPRMATRNRYRKPSRSWALDTSVPDFHHGTVICVVVYDLSAPEHCEGIDEYKGLHFESLLHRGGKRLSLSEAWRELTLPPATILFDYDYIDDGKDGYYSPDNTPPGTLFLRLAVPEDANILKKWLDEHPSFSRRQDEPH